MAEIEEDEAESLQEADLLAMQAIRQDMASLLDEDRVWLMDQPQFRRFFFDILERSGMWTPSRYAQTSDLHHHEGRRALGLELLGELQRLDPNVQLHVIVENVRAQESMNERRPNTRNRNRGSRR